MLDPKKIKDEVKGGKAVQKKSNFIGSKKFHKGHKIYSINKQTFKIKEFTPFSVGDIPGKPKFSKRVIVEKDCVYLGALNKKNLIKKLAKIYPSQIDEIKSKNQ